MRSVQHSSPGRKTGFRAEVFPFFILFICYIISCAIRMLSFVSVARLCSSNGGSSLQSMINAWMSIFIFVFCIFVLLSARISTRRASYMSTTEEKQQIKKIIDIKRLKYKIKHYIVCAL